MRVRDFNNAYNAHTHLKVINNIVVNATTNGAVVDVVEGGVGDIHL